MVLTSLVGDADLYISDATNERPTFMFEEHELSSTTCGVDTIDIPASFARPVHIAVYGHPNYPLSKFNLDGVIIEEDEFDHFAQGSYGDNDEEEVKKDRRKSREDDYDDGLPDYLKEGSPLRTEVEEGNYTYYTLRQTGHVLMVLTSLTGDADLYISDATNDRPTFMFEEHELSSTTCGVDTVDIPASFARPVHIA